jgi:peptidoglycan/xylan/chitin deacetylase (PgdA/CDA1 family)
MKRLAIGARRLVPRPDPSSRRVVLCYHSVHPNRPYLSSTPELFDRHLQWLNEHCQIASLSDLANGAVKSREGKALVAITFDDGHADNHACALPILAKYRAPATFFITAGYVEREPAVLRRLQHLLECGADDLEPLAWSQIRELAASGMEIGAHTYSHPNLARLSPEDTEKELRISRDSIADRLGGPVDSLAYPFGKPRIHFTPTTTEIASAIGYRLGVSVTFRGVRQSDSRLEIPRFFTDGDNLAKLEAKVLGDYELVGWWQEHAPLPLMRVVSPHEFAR